MGLECRFAMEPLESRLAPAVSVWSGAVDNLWSTDGNWSEPPAEGNDLIFPSGAANTTNVNDLAAGTSFVSLTLSGTGYVIGGEAISLTGDINATYGAGTSEVNLPIDSTSLAVAVDQATAVLELGGVISGSDGLTKVGGGELDLTGANVYTGTTTVSAGVLRVDGVQPTSPISLAAGTTLRGSGTVGAITSVGATVNPIATLPTVLTDTGDLTLDAASTFAVTLNGIVAGAEHSQLVVAGQVTLAGASLSTTLGFTPVANEQFVIINNTGTADVSGTFANLPEGAEFTAGGQSFQITYDGGDGNDVVLIHLLATTTTVDAAPTSSVFGQQVTLMATVAAAGGGGTPSGSVEFFSGSTSLGTAFLNAGTATLATSALPVGTDQLTARYNGDDVFATSTSAEFAVTVAQASTTTALANAPNPTAFGESVALTVSVSPVAPGSGTPTGTVELFNGATSLGTVTLNNGAATLTTTTLPVGNNTITAVFQGDPNFTGSTSPAVTATVNQASTTTVVSVAPNPSSTGQSVALTASVSPVSPGAGTPTGDVEFFSGSTSLGTASLNGGVAVLSTTALAQGTSSITAQYKGDPNFTASTSPAVTATVNQGTTTALSVTPTSLVFGQQVTMTATVTPTGGGTGTPTGSVSFFSGTTPLGNAALIDGVATLTSNNVPGGTSVITAQYTGDSTFGGSTSPGTNVTVTHAPTSSALSASPNPSSLGQQVTLTVIVSSESASNVRPTGTVQFFNGSTALGTATLSATGVAILTTAALPVGANTITVQYPGDANYAGSTSNAVNVNVKQASTTTLTVDPASTVVGQEVALTATVAPSGTATGTPTGTVQFFNGSTPLGNPVTLTNGVATLRTRALPVGTALIRARYLGDDTFGTSDSPSQTVMVGQASSATSLTVSPNPSAFSQLVTLRATVVAVGPATGTPTGTVEFFRGTTSLGDPVALVNGVATLTTSELPLGTSSITAVYQGTASFRTSTSPAVTATVRESNSRVSLTVSKDDPVAFEAVRLTATVAASNTSTGTPTGDVVFLANGRVLGTATLANGVATLATGDLPLGNVVLRAVYQGDDNFNGSQSPSVRITTGTQVERYLNQVYVDALSRPARLSELDLWRTQLRIGGPRLQVVTRIVNSPEGQINSVRTFYRTILRRLPTNREILAGTRALRGTTGFGYEASLFGSRDYFLTQGGGTNNGFLTALFRDVLGTAVPATSRARLLNALNRGTSRTTVARNLVESQPGKTSLVNRLLRQVLGRPATSAETSLYLRQFNRGASIRQVFTSILSSNVFFAQFRDPS